MWGILRTNTPEMDRHRVRSGVCHILVSLWCRAALHSRLGDILQCVLLLCGTIAILANTKAAPRRVRLFWMLVGFGVGMWLCSQVLWTYFEVFLRHEAPNPFVGDVILFLHIVPLMAAVAVQPHLRQDDRTKRVGALDFHLLLIWWLFLYLFVVIPWQYVYPVESTYAAVLMFCMSANNSFWVLAGSGVAAQYRLVAQDLRPPVRGRITRLRQFAHGKRGD